MKLSKPTLRIDVNHDGWYWCLAFDGGQPEQSGLRLTFCAPGAPGTEIVAAQISSEAQIGAMIDRICDEDDNAYALARELLDLLLTLASQTPKPDCVAYMIFRMCIWISENRRVAMGDARAA